MERWPPIYERVDAPIFAGRSASTLTTGRMRAECLWLAQERAEAVRAFGVGDGLRSNHRGNVGGNACGYP